MQRIINITLKLLYFKDSVLLVNIKNIKIETSNLNLYKSIDDIDNKLNYLFNDIYIKDKSYLLNFSLIIALASPNNFILKGSYIDKAITYR